MSEQTVGLGDATSVTETVQQTGNGAAKPESKKGARGSVTSDAQLVACIKIDKTLAQLTESQRDFVLAYITGKYIGSN
jgi:hypothetical protein